MAYVKARRDETLDSLLSRFRKKFEKEKILNEIKKREAYIKPSAKKYQHRKELEFKLKKKKINKKKEYFSRLKERKFKAGD